VVGFSDPPERKEHVHTRFQRGYLKDFPCVVLLMLKKSRPAVFVACSWHPFPSEIVKGDWMFMFKDRDTPFFDEVFADKWSGTSRIQESMYRGLGVGSPVEDHRHDRSVAVKWLLGRLFGRSSTSRVQLSSLSILRRSNNWFVRTLSFVRSSTDEVGERGSQLRRCRPL
jgi:hypothetical protein